MPPSTTPISATSTPLVRLFGTGPDQVSLKGGLLRFGDAQATPVGAIDSIQTHRSWFWTRLTVRQADGAEHAIGGLDREEAERLTAAVLTDAAHVARTLASNFTQLDHRLNRLHAGSRYARESQTSGLQADIASAIQRGGGALTRSFLPAQTTEALSRIQSVARIQDFEAAREQANARFVAATVPAVTRAAHGVLSSPPTAEQAEAIATDEDTTLVLAGAGTGKTAVITGKVAHLVRNRGVPPRQILVLAFNRKAAQEIRERLPDDLAGAHVSTFHAFGRRVIAQVESSPTLSKLAEDEAMLPAAIDRILVDLVDDPRQSRGLADFITRHRAGYRSQFEFKTPGQYYDHVRRIELRTLSGDLVKSFEELEIANFLTLNGVNFHYERPYPVETASPRHRQYRPDFYLPDHDLYIEHFALDRQGRPPEGWTGYADGVRWKRVIHQQNRTRLIQTFSWQQRQGVLRQALRQQLEEAGVTFQRVPIRSLLLELGRWLISWLAQLIATFLNHVKTSGVSADTLRQRARDSRDRARSEAFLDIFEQVSERYDKLLGEDKDFHDLINHAAAHIRNGRWQSPYRYVLVDEFQDISAGRMALLRALRGRGVAYFLVGDDWQSIYRFAGSDVALVRQCGHHLGHVRERALSRTFRFARGIMEPSTAFVVRNPAQTQRTLRPARGVRDGGVTVIASEDPAHGLWDALHDIQACEGDAGPPLTVLVLGRYRRSQGALPSSRQGRLRLEFSTVHSAKGREADYVVVLDLRDTRLGFPSQHQEDPLLHLVLPPTLPEKDPTLVPSPGRPLHNPGSGDAMSISSSGRRSYPLQGERQIRASSTEIGEGSSGHPTLGYAEVSPAGEGWGEGSSGQPAPGYADVSTGGDGSVRDLPRNHPADTQRSPRGSPGRPSKMRLDLKDASALAPSPGRHLHNPGSGRAMSISSSGRRSYPLQGERQIRASSAEIGEGSSAQPSPIYAEVSPGGEGSLRGLPDNNPQQSPGASYPHAEERRLFYVAITRARRGAYLVADARRPSAFVNELLRESTGLRRLGEFMRDNTPKCPRCRTGTLNVSSTGQSMTCLNAPFCSYRAPRCQRCRRGFLVITDRSSHCTNLTCQATPPVCQSCRAGVMVIRKAPRGSFLGCTQYASDQPCTNTHPLPRRLS